MPAAAAAWNQLMNAFRNFSGMMVAVLNLQCLSVVIPKGYSTDFISVGRIPVTNDKAWFGCGGTTLTW